MSDDDRAIAWQCGSLEERIAGSLAGTCAMREILRSGSYSAEFRSQPAAARSLRNSFSIY